MEGRLVLKNCSVFRSDGRFRSGMAVLIERGKITKIALDPEVPILPGDWEVACRGRLVAPGLADCHAHLVSGQLLPSGEALLKAPEERFEAQRAFESNLAAAEVEALTAFAIARALCSGVTMIVEHVHCPSDVAGGLAAQSRTAERLGARFINSHATSSRSGQSSAAAQLEANAAHAQALKQHPLVRCALGFRASFACDDDLLSRLGRLRMELGVGAHGHAAESEEDLARTAAQYKERIVERFDRHGLLGGDCIAAQGRPIDEVQFERLAQTGTVVAVSPLSRLIDNPGGGWDAFLVPHALIALGTGGSISLREEALVSFAAAMRLARLGQLLDPERMLSRVLRDAPAQLIARVFGEATGAVEVGESADLVVYDFIPSEENASERAPLLLVDLVRSPVAWTIIAGQVVVREGRFLAHDYLELAEEAHSALHSLRSRTGVHCAAPPSGGGAELP